LPQSLRDIRELLQAYGIHPNRRLGQNFLHDAAHLQRIVETADPKPGDRVLEVGPGTGVLTERLLDRGASVVAVEVDAGLAALLRDRLGGHPRFQLIHADALAGKHALAPPLLDAVADAPFQLVANLPYAIASPLLINLLEQAPHMTAALVMVQKEVAQRLLAEPGGKTFGPLTVLAQAHTTVRRIAALPPGCFWPAPEIDSAVVQLRRRDQPLVEPGERLGPALHALFSQRRKQLRRILDLPRADPADPSPAIPGWPSEVVPSQRPETLSVEQLIALIRCSRRIGKLP